MEKKQDPLWTKKEMEDLNRHIDQDPHFSPANPNQDKNQTDKSLIDPEEMPRWVYDAIHSPDPTIP